MPICSYWNEKFIKFIINEYIQTIKSQEKIFDVIYD